jgi:hypothetical protein
MSFLPLDGPAVEGSISVSTIAELKVGANPLEERKVVTFQCQTGRIRWGFTNAITSTTGYVAFKNQIITVEASDRQPIYVVAESGTQTVYFSERA